jgi:SAM-dependent methyltransferase
VVHETWDSGSSYDSYVGRWSRLAAREFIDWIDVAAGGSWLDVGCGTGSLSEAILDAAGPLAVRGIDPSPGYAALANDRLADRPFEAEVGDAMQLPSEDGTFDAVVSALALNFVSDAAAATREMRRVAKDGATVAAYVWDYAGDVQFIRYFWDAVVSLHPQDRAFDEGVRFPMCTPANLTALFSEAGLVEPTTRAIDVPTIFRDFDDYWTPFLGGEGPAPGYCTALSEGGRDELRELIRSRLPIRSDGSIHLVARAWGVRAGAPGA